MTDRTYAELIRTRGKIADYQLVEIYVDGLKMNRYSWLSEKRCLCFLYFFVKAVGYTKFTKWLDFGGALQ